MHEFTPDQTRRWNVWQQANVVAARRSDVIARMVAVTALTMTVVAVLLALWQR